MAHWEHRPEEGWKKFRFNQHYEKGLKRLKEEVLAKTDFDPATLWQWGNMQAMAVIQILKDIERNFGAEGQRVVREAIKKVGKDVGRQIVSGITKPEGMSDAELISFFATVINRIAYASLEDPTIDSEDMVSFHILWCPHQDHYSAFDCRVQRYFVEGMIEALKETGECKDWQVRFTQTIPAGAPTCRFELWRAPEQEREAWDLYTEQLEKKALEIAQKEGD
jgi:predicted hydrocarbon binding protein